MFVYPFCSLQTPRTTMLDLEGRPAVRRFWLGVSPSIARRELCVWKLPANDREHMTRVSIKLKIEGPEWLDFKRRSKIATRQTMRHLGFWRAHQMRRERESQRTAVMILCASFASARRSFVHNIILCWSHRQNQQMLLIRGDNIINYLSSRGEHYCSNRNRLTFEPVEQQVSFT